MMRISDIIIGGVVLCFVIGFVLLILGFVTFALILATIGLLTSVAIVVFIVYDEKVKSKKEVK
jgi:hypothetical protein